MRPIVALLTDFGQSGWYVGALRGAVLSACPDATLLDITHEVSPHDVLGAAYAIEAIWRSLPKGTVLLAVVDPGVGSSRRPIAAASGDGFAVGPDNGIFTPLLADDRRWVAHVVTSPRFTTARLSPTFHGRDLFAPVAGFLAAGGSLDEVGPRIADPVRLDLPKARPLGDGSFEVHVLECDRFGSLTCDLFGTDLSEFLAAAGAGATLDGKPLPLASTYADVPAGGVLGLVGSSGRFEIAVSCGSAAQVLSAGVGTAFVLSPRIRVTR